MAESDTSHIGSVESPLMSRFTPKGGGRPITTTTDQCTHTSEHAGVLHGPSVLGRGEVAATRQGGGEKTTK